MTATSLDDTLTRLDDVLATARSEKSPIGIFPAMYRSVTGEIHRAIRTGGFFDDDARIEQLTVTFADLYLDAVAAHRRDEPVARCWQQAFQIAEQRRRRMILQHLLLGMNAHINLDLGIATARTAADRMPAVWGDYIRVNEILFQVLDTLQGQLGNVSPRISLLDRFGGPLDEHFMRIGIRTARDLAWHFAEHLDDAFDWEHLVAERDEDVAWLGRTLIRSWSPIDIVGRLVAAAETRNVVAVIDSLSTVDVDLEEVAQEARRSIPQPPGPNRPLRRRTRRTT